MRFSFFSLTLLVAAACTSELSTLDSQLQSGSDGISVSVMAPDFVSGNCSTKSNISTIGTFAWTAGDKIGLFSNQIGSATQTTSQLALTLSAGEGTSIAYSSTTGWGLIPGSTFNYFSYYPYSDSNSRDEITIDYTGQTLTANNSTAGIGEYDYMYSDIATATSSSAASFSFHHIGCLVNVSITVPEGYESTTFYHMRLYAETPLFASNGKYSVTDVMTSGKLIIDWQNGVGFDVPFVESGIQAEDGVINLWFMMPPTQWGGKAITARLYAAKNNVPTLSGTFTPAENLTEGSKYTYSVKASSLTEHILPDRPVAGEQLHILLFGHSFGVDCTEYLPYITRACGITDVHYSRFYQPDAALWQHWGHIIDKDHYRFHDNDYLTAIWKGEICKKTDDVLDQYPWDIILFQQNIGFNGEGNYSSYQPYLNYLTEYVTSYCETVHGKTPIIGWNMFWGYNQGNYIDYDRGATGANAMYQSIVQAAKDMTADDTKATPIPLIVPAGTALQNARGTSLNDPGSLGSPSTTKLLTRDGYHASFGIGRYTVACTWFQYLIAPIYGVSIENNTYRPYPYVLGTNYSFDGDQVTDERAAICWKCAIEAVNHPYEVTTITE